MKRLTPIFAAICTVAFFSTPAMCAESERAQEIAELRELLRQQQQQMEAMAARIALLEQQEQDAATTAATQQQPVTRIPRPRTAEAPAAPVAGPLPAVKNRHQLTIYGYIKVDAVYDSHTTASGNLAFRSLPRNGMGNDDAFYLTAKQSRLGLRWDSDAWQGWDVEGRIEADFYGSASEQAANPRLRLAYVELDNEDWQLCLGQAYDAWNTVLPNTVNFATMGQHGALWSRRPIVKASRKLALSSDAQLWLTAAAARTVGGDRDGGGQDDGADSALPTLQWNLGYQRTTDNGLLQLAFGGHYGWETLDLNGKDSDDYSTRLAMLSFHLPLSPQLSASGALWTGQNLGNFNGGIGQTINLAAEKEIRASGGWLQLAAKLSPKVTLHLLGGVDEPRAADLATGMRESNRTAAINLYYRPAGFLTLACEYQYLTTKYKELETATTHRLQTAMIFAF